MAGFVAWRAGLARLSEMLIVLVSFGQTTDEATTVCCVCLVLVRLVQAWLALLEWASPLKN